MPQFAEPIPAPPLKKSAAPAAARPRPRPSNPVQRAVIGHVLQRRAAESAAAEAAPKTPNRSGLPKWLKAGVERLSGLAMDDVRVHRNSAEPAGLGALAFTKGSDIHLGPGQEQHLPHEAWHVIQQKQGRVKATTQLKGMAVNEDAGLEAEADRMGAQATTGAPVSRATGLRLAPSSGDVVQGKLLLQGVPPSESQKKASKTIDKLEKAAGTYVLRDDWEPSSPDKIHVIEGNKIYLVGEDHLKSTWADDVLHWTWVAKIDEGIFETPGSTKPATWSRGGPALPMDNIGTYLLNTCIVIQNCINSVLEPDQPLTIKRLGDHIAVSMYYARSIVIANNLYDDFYLATKSGVLTDQDKIVRSFIVVLQKNIENLIHSIGILAGLKAAMEAPDYVDTEGNRKLMQPSLAELKARRGSITRIVDGLLPVLGIGPSTKQGKLIVATAAPSPRFSANTFKAGKPARESAMVAHIEAAGRPLLAKIGYLHIDSVAKALGTGIVKIKEDHRLAEFTAWPLKKRK